MPGAGAVSATGTAITLVAANDSKLSIVARHEIDNKKTIGVEDLEKCMAIRLEYWDEPRIHENERTSMIPLKHDDQAL